MQASRTTGTPRTCSLAESAVDISGLLDAVRSSAKLYLNLQKNE